MKQNFQFEPLTVPIDCSVSCITGTIILATSNTGDFSELYNPYDETPGDRLENLYDEIHSTNLVISTVTDENLQNSPDSRQPTAGGKETFFLAN